MYELAQCIQLAVDADLVNLYLVETEGEITKYCPDAENRCGNWKYFPSNIVNIFWQHGSRVPGGGGHHGGGLLRLHQARHPGHTPYSIYLHLSIYSIYLLHLFIVVSICRWPCPGTRRTATSSPTESRATRSNKGLQKYFLAGWPV